MRKGKEASLQRLEELKQRAKEADLPSIAESLGFRLKREGRTWRLPGHGGLILWQTPEGLWQWTWFSQDKGGDAISFLQEFANMSFIEAIEYLTGETFKQASSSKASSYKGLPQKASSQQVKEAVHDKEQDKGQGEGLTEEAVLKWRQKSKEFLEKAHKALFSPLGKEVLRWLKEKRGISEESIKRFKLGFSLRERQDKARDWGLESKGKDKVWLPLGLVIPYFTSEGEVLGLLFRLFKPGEVKGIKKESKLRYYFLSPWERPIMTFGKVGSPLVVVESELDLVLLSDLAERNEFALASLGSVGKKPRLTKDKGFFTYFLTAPLVLVALDNDEAGKSNSEKWIATYKHAFKWLPDEGKDPTELWKRWGELGLVEWLLNGFEEAIKKAPKDSPSKEEKARKTYFFLTVEYFARLEALKKETLGDFKASLQKEKTCKGKALEGKALENKALKKRAKPLSLNFQGVSFASSSHENLTKNLTLGF